MIDACGRAEPAICGPQPRPLGGGTAHRKGPVSGAKYAMLQGNRRTARLEIAKGDRLTVDGTIMAAKWLLEYAPEGGYTTPSLLMGARGVEQLPGSTAIRLD